MLRSLNRNGMKMKNVKNKYTNTHTLLNPLRVLQYKITEGTGKFKHSEGTEGFGGEGEWRKYRLNGKLLY